ncbi:helix-turn-helix domain-containing protein, partial [Desulfomarina sp.]
NPELELAGEFLASTDQSIFLTGKAGTGKTTFLKNLRKKSPKRMVVTAPTGVAAINAGGVTLHSFFQLPFGPFVPGSEAFSQSSRRRFRKEKVNIIKSLDLLVIDEISMVRSDMLDGVDSVLRRYRRSNLPFGGVQLLMIGDLHQLAPVVRENEWRLLSPHYESPYFFSSNSLKQTEFHTIELQHIYRQSDKKFIDLLNRVRDNNLDESSLQELNRRYQPDISSAEKEGYITLCTHNRNADDINRERLNSLSSPARRFEAEIVGDFPEHTYPTSALLELKEGAQVMFVRNDSSPEKLYFNGKIGKILHIRGKEILVKCPGDTDPITVAPETWENIEYKLDEESGEIKENRIGEFEQYPLKLAWAITIHKSQGLTFNHAIIDAQAAFAHGQVYVALSRCRTLEGLVLSSPLSRSTIKSDPTIAGFTRQSRENGPDRELLERAAIRYQQRLLLECFDFGKLRYLLGRFTGLVKGNESIIHLVGVTDMEKLRQNCFTEICTVGENFRRQLQGLFREDILPTDDQAILERTGKASDYFGEKLQSLLLAPIDSLSIDTDNRELGKRLRKAHKQLREEGHIKIAAITVCGNAFSPAAYLRALSEAELDFHGKKEKNKAPVYTEEDITHPELFQTIRQWRMDRAKKDNIAPFQILHQKTLVQIIMHLPQTRKALLRIRGIGKVLAERYGEEILTMVSDYCKKHNIESPTLPESGGPGNSDETKKKKGKPVKKTTIDLTLELFKKNLTIQEIAKERELVPTTIQRHLAKCVELGKIDIEQLMPPEKIQIITDAMKKTESSLLSEVKEALGEEYSYEEIRYVQAHLQKT